MAATTPRKPRVRKPTVAELAASEASAADQLEAEAAALDTDWDTQTLPTGKRVRVRPLMDWPRSTYRAIAVQGDFEAIADVIHEDDAAAWEAWDSTIGELIEWVMGVIEDAGSSLGNSSGPKRSSRITRRR